MESWILELHQSRRKFYRKADEKQQAREPISDFFSSHQGIKKNKKSHSISWFSTRKHLARCLFVCVIEKLSSVAFLGAAAGLEIRQRRFTCWVHYSAGAKAHRPTCPGTHSPVSAALRAALLLSAVQEIFRSHLPTPHSWNPVLSSHSRARAPVYTHKCADRQIQWFSADGSVCDLMCYVEQRWTLCGVMCF